jgi:hypothetical protein
VTLGLSHCPGGLSDAQNVCPGWLGQGCSVVVHIADSSRSNGCTQPTFAILLQYKSWSLVLDLL